MQHEWFADYDEGRTEIFERLRVRMLRFTNPEVCDDLDVALVRICEELRLPFVLETSVPSPLPLSRRERGSRATRPAPGGIAALNSAIWSICDVLRRPKCAGAMQYVPKLTWILFLRVLDG